MKKFMLVLILVANSLFGYQLYSAKLIKKYKKEILSFTPSQIYWLRQVYVTCEQFNLQYTCMSIAWEESKFNKYCENEKTGDYGLMGINLYWYLKDNHIKAGYWKRQEIKTKLIRDDTFNIMYAIGRIKYWSKYWHGDWVKTWGSYNGGNRPNYKYAKRIYNRMQVLKWWIKNKIYDHK